MRLVDLKPPWPFWYWNMVQIQEIRYTTSQHINRISMLHLQYICFKNAMLLKIHLQGRLKLLTSRKLFGSCYHSFIIHKTQQYRLVSGRNSNVESEKATFNAINVAANLTSSHHHPMLLLMLWFVFKQRINWMKTNWHLKKNLN